MLSLQPTTFTTPNHLHSLIDQVLHLRQQLGIDISLSVRDSEEMHLSPRELQASSMETPSAYDSQDWLIWSQSPCEGNLPEKGQEELFRCQ